jgi:hypothetical protein
MIGPSGWIRTTTSRVKSPACCVHTSKGSCSWSEWRDSNPHLKAWKARRQPLPHIRPGSASVSIVDTQTEHGPVAFTGPGTPVSCQRPHSCELAWRQRQDSNPDPRGLEARMLPLHHAVVVASHLDGLRDKPPHGLTRAFCRASDQKQKRPSRGSPQKACFSMNAGPLGCFPLRIERAAIGAIDPDRCHGSTHTGGDSRGAGQMEWPSWRRALRVEENSSQRNLGHNVRARVSIVNSKVRRE